MQCLFRRAAVPAALCRRHLSSAAAQYAVAPYRALIHATDEQRATWAIADERLHSKMREHVPEALAHNGEEEFDKRAR